LKRLQDEGYELEVKEGHAIIHHVPYLDAERKVQFGVLVSKLGMAGDRVTYNNDHVAFFQGSMPHHANGKPMKAVVNQSQPGTMAGVPVNWMLSNKPTGGYRDYYDKFARYIQILSAEAQAVDPTVTAKTFSRIVTNNESVFRYEDTNASRAAITDVTAKLKGQIIGIIGLGGTGSYILDLVAKTSVSEIHLFDGDVFCQHNAFRAPGAPDVSVFEPQPYKTEYYAQLYGRMHKGIKSHPYLITENTVDELQDLDFVFIAMDSGENKRVLVDFLKEHHIRFIDSGIDVQRNGDSLFGMARVTVFRNDEKQDITQHISFAEADKDLYSSNIQTAELNTICAVLSVLEWKKLFGFYADIICGCNGVYTSNDGEMTWS
jgi:hypothetical protein